MPGTALATREDAVTLADRALDEKDDDRRHGQAIDWISREPISDAKAQIVLAAGEPILGIYRKATPDAHLLDEAIEGRPGHRSHEEPAGHGPVHRQVESGDKPLHF